MREEYLSTPTFESVLAPLLEGHLKEKRAGGYRYCSEARYLRDLDKFLIQEAHNSRELPKELIECWIAKRSSESPKTYSNRIVIIRQFVEYLLRLGISAYVPPSILASIWQDTFVPHIFTVEEIRRFLSEVDRLCPEPRSPLRHIIMPEIFRLLYFCGLRVSEVRKLRLKDVDFSTGVLTIRNTKFGKDRLVPMTDSLVNRLRTYSGRLGVRNMESYLFPSRDGGYISHSVIYQLFRTILKRIGIEHGGRGYGPRLHDLRHTFAVHRLISWYRKHENLNAKLPLLATYLGHQGMSGTQRYLHLVPELFPEVTETLENYVGHVIPGREVL